MKVLTLSVIVAIFGLVLLAAFIRTTAGHPDPGIGKIFEGSWVDKIPSVEVQFKTDGISVSTGPSREEIYWMIGYIIAGLVVFLTLIFCVGFCLYKCCWGRMSMSPRVVLTDGIQLSSDAPMLQQEHYHYSHPRVNFVSRGTGPVTTKFSRAFQPSINSQVPLTTPVHDVTSPPPYAYRSTN